MNMKSRILIMAVAAFSVWSFGLAHQSFAETDDVNMSTEPQMTVYKTPTCGCCKKWVTHLEEKGLVASTIDLVDLSNLKNKLGIQGRYRSCHTGVVKIEDESYIFEGHVPAKYIKVFLSDVPEGAIGLSVPGMPVGSPGMEVGERKDYYQVLLLNGAGTSSVFAHVNQVK